MEQYRQESWGGSVAKRSRKMTRLTTCQPKGRMEVRGHFTSFLSSYLNEPLKQMKDLYILKSI